MQHFFLETVNLTHIVSDTLVSNFGSLIVKVIFHESFLFFSPTECVFKLATIGLESFSTRRTFLTYKDHCQNFQAHSDSILSFICQIERQNIKIIIPVPTRKSEFCCHSLSKSFLKIIEISFSCRCNFFFA